VKIVRSSADARRAALTAVRRALLSFSSDTDFDVDGGVAVGMRFYCEVSTVWVPSCD